MSVADGFALFIGRALAETFLCLLGAALFLGGVVLVEYIKHKRRK